MRDRVQGGRGVTEIGLRIHQTIQVCQTGKGDIGD